MNDYQSYKKLNTIRLDWLATLLYLVLVATGLAAVYSTTHSGEETRWFSMGTLYGKQLVWSIISLVTVGVLLAIDRGVYERFAGLIYLFSLGLLAGLFLFGTTVKGQTNWYRFAGISFQPSEFVKPAVALALAKVMSDPLFDIRKLKDFTNAAAVVLVPAVLIALLPDMGTAMVFGGFVFVFLREGMPSYIFWISMLLVLLFMATVKFGPVATWLFVIVVLLLFSYISYRKRPIFLHRNWGILTVFALSVSLVIAGSHWSFRHVLKKHHTDRLSLWLRLEKDPAKLRYLKRDYGYNNDQSIKAIAAGGWSGKGFLQGERTRGDFVPEQHTDYIFSAIGEEFGFAGASLVVVVFVALILRLIWLSGQQRSAFSRIYGYSVASLLFVHFFINIGMVTDLLPTVGIPLPYISYGGSSLWGFTVLLFIFLRMDAHRHHEL